ncbi:MAG: hypothetical protein LC769_05305 [Chloroflexi bacterium]|nr:hypothetical protein [Chloroflexota bacterium]
MRRIATLSRLLVTSDPVAALRADEMLRAVTITIVQGWELMTIGGRITGWPRQGTRVAL